MTKQEAISKLITIRPALSTIKLDGANDFASVKNIVGEGNLKHIASKVDTNWNGLIFDIIEELNQSADTDILDMF